MTELITRLLALAERAVDRALVYDWVYDCSDPEDRYIYRELQELRDLVQQRADGPTDEKILMTYQHAVSSKVESIVQSTGDYQGTLHEHAAVTLAGLHAVLARWGCPAIEPVPEEPTDIDIEDLMRQHTSNLGDNLIGVATQDVPALIRAALSHWGRPAIEPVPVSERLPEAKDCDSGEPTKLPNKQHVDELLSAISKAYSAYGWIPSEKFICLLDEVARLAGIVEEGWDASIDPGSIKSEASAVFAHLNRLAIEPISAAQLLEPEWRRQADQTRKTTDGAQLICGEWWAPCSNPFSMQRILDNARAYAARFGGPAIKPVPVTDEDLYQFWESHPELGLTCDEPVKFARAVLAHFGQPVIEPVPVSEGPPKAKDCDAEGRCYIWDWLSCEWRAIEALNKPLDGWGTTWWLPFHALPAPASQEAS